MAYPEASWNKVKLDYESGKISSHAELGRKYGISEVAIADRSKRDGWIKGQLAEKAERTMQQKFIDAFVARGYDEKKVSHVIVDMMEATKNEDKPDQWARDKAIKHYGDFTGAKAPQKIEHSGEQQIIVLPADKDVGEPVNDAKAGEAK